MNFQFTLYDWATININYKDNGEILATLKNSSKNISLKFTHTIFEKFNFGLLNNDTIYLSDSVFLYFVSIKKTLIRNKYEAKFHIEDYKPYNGLIISDGNVLLSFNGDGKINWEYWHYEDIESFLLNYENPFIVVNDTDNNQFKINPLTGTFF